MENEKSKLKIVKPHKLVSREVTENDLGRVYEFAMEMYDLLNKPQGLYNRFYALAHAQVTDVDPLRFFMINPDAEFSRDFPEAVIVNPTIKSTYGVEKIDEEGCMSFIDIPMVKVSRPLKCDVEFYYLQEDLTLSEKCEMKLTGKSSRIFQHEVDHLNSKYINEIL